MTTALVWRADIEERPRADNDRGPPQDDPEFSDFGRSSRIPPGWWIVPAFAAMIALVVWLLV